MRTVSQNDVHAETRGGNKTATDKILKLEDRKVIKRYRMLRGDSEAAVIFWQLGRTLIAKLDT